MNLVEILKNVPKGTKLYSIVAGYVTFKGISDNELYPILCTTTNNEEITFTKEGIYESNLAGECVLFPSKENKDWNNFKVEKSYDFKPFDKVLVRNDDNEPWSIQFFGYYDIFAENKQHYVCLGNSMFIANTFKQCIPFEGYENLIGTTTSPDSIYPA